MNKTNGHEEMTADYAMEQAAFYIEQMIELAFEQGEDLAPRLESIFTEVIRMTRENHRAIGLPDDESEAAIAELEKRMAKTLETVREDDKHRRKSS